MREQYLIGLILLVNTVLLLYGVNTLSIRYEEAQVFFEGSSLVHDIINFSTQIFGQNDLALRLPFIFLHLISLILLYKIGKQFLKRKIDRVTSVALYAMLPGVNSAALLVNEAYLVIFLTLLFVALYMYEYKYLSYTVLLGALFCDASFAILYFSLFFFGLFKKDTKLFVLTLIFFSLSLYIYGFDTGGKPKGYFLDTLGVYAAIFSPLLFLYFVYSMYRILIKEEKNLLWYISFGTLVASLLLSMRQKLALEDFAPFVVIAVPLMVKIFFNSYRVRLPIHRKYHNITFGVVLTLLVINLGFTFVNKPLYYFVKKADDHFAYKYHIVKDLVSVLNKKDIVTINTDDEKLALRLKFYGIQSGGRHELYSSNDKEQNLNKIDIKYFGKTVETFYVNK
jgi:hypothetical protein